MDKREIDRTGDSQSPEASSVAHPADIGELTILLDRKFGSAAYIGNRAQLESEGVVPATTEWPEKFDTAGWVAGGIQYWLRRARPEGAKGPRKDFLNCDNWRLSMYRFNRDRFDHEIMRKAEELQKVLDRDSRAGRAASAKLWAATCAAMDDPKFQAFKALVPGLVPEPRTRRGGRPTQARKIEQ
ncbi:hypothetical protein [Burkholderia paludis]|uniref:hypothetical protein n=1 Tax=Burkholderia paludis TaxID=1506587 RepID=UPI0012699527|nr:hypothetical protein [Burkholderia paludis]